MTTSEIEVINTMAEHGGSFVKALANAFLHADSENFAKLKSAFPKYWLQYADMVKTKLAQEIDAERYRFLRNFANFDAVATALNRVDCNTLEGAIDYVIQARAAIAP